MRLACNLVALALILLALWSLLWVVSSSSMASMLAGIADWNTRVQLAGR